MEEHCTYKLKRKGQNVEVECALLNVMLLRARRGGGLCNNFGPVATSRDPLNGYCNGVTVSQLPVSVTTALGDQILVARTLSQ